MRERVGRLLEQVAAGVRAVEVTLIRPGVSQNGRRYSPEVLRESLPLWEGATAFVDHPNALDGTRAGGRSVRDIAGVYRRVRWEEGVGLRGELHFAPGAGWLGELVAGAIADRRAGLAVPNVGLSVDMLAARRPAETGAGRVLEVTRIVRVNSVDVVFNPSAGGSFDGVVEAEEGEREAREVDVFEISDAVILREQTEPEAIVGAPPPAAVAPGIQPAGEAAGGSASTVAVVAEAGTTAPTVLTPVPGGGVGVELEAARGLRVQLCGELLEARLMREQLPEVAAAEMRRRLGGRLFEAVELEREVTALRGLLGARVAESVVRGNGAAAGAGELVPGLGPVDKFQHALDRLFGLTIPDGVRDLPRLRGIREAYVLATGDHGMAGQYDWDASILREANETTTAQLPNLLRNSMTKRLVRDYQAQDRWWEPVCTIAAVSDLKTQDRILLADFGAFPTVLENAAYVNAAWADSRETYTPAKRGRTVVITWEAILNDDTNGITRMPSKLASAAAVTINEFVANLFTSNPAMADGSTVYDAGVQTTHLNAGTVALSAAALETAFAAMLKQTNSAAKRIGVRPRFLLVPPDILFTALTLVNSTLKPGTANNDVNVFQNALQVVNVPQFTDVNDWYLQADPAVLDGIEVGFLNGQREPELLVQDQQVNGAVFTNDAITFKVRWVFGGGWLDYRGAYRNVVA